MKKFKFYFIAAMAGLILCSFSVNAEETTDIQDTTQATEAIDVTEPIEEFTEATEPTECTATTEVTTVTTVSETTEITATTAIEIDENRPLGDVNNDGQFNVRDAAYVARYIALGKINELDLYYADYNNDGKIDVRDCAKMANELTDKSSQQAADKRKGLPTYPQKSDYNLKTDSGMKAYVNDMTRYKAFTKYGITAVAYDDTVNVWDYSWDVPEVYLSDVDSYLEKNDGILTIGSSMYKLPDNYKKSGWEGMFSIAKDESEMADILVNSQTVALDMMVSEFKATGDNDYSISRTHITLSWQLTDGIGNYEVYLLWSGPKVNYFKDIKPYKEYWRLTDEMYEIEKNNYYNKYIKLYETNGDEYMVESRTWYYIYEDIILDVDSEGMSWAVYKEKILHLGSYDDPNDYSWMNLSQEQLDRLNEFVAEMSSEDVDALMKDLKTACINDTVDEFLDSIGA